MARLIEATRPDAHWLLDDLDIELAVQQIAASDIQHLWISDEVDLGAVGLGFLKLLPNLKGLAIGAKKPIDISHVVACKHLEDLMLGDQISKGLHLNELSYLKKLSLTVCKHQSLPSQAMPHLEMLTIWDNKALDLGFLEIFPNLKSLHIFEARKLLSLRGLETCKFLRRLDIAYCPLLSNADQLERLNQLEDIELTSLKRLDSYIEHFPTSLKRIIIKDLPEIKRLSSFKKQTQLELLTLVNVNVLDGDLSLLMNLPKLNHCHIQPNKPHYQPKASVIYDTIKARSSDN